MAAATDAYYHPLTQSVVCKFWVAGRCTRQPCRFLHQFASLPFSPIQSTNVAKIPSTVSARNSKADAKTSDENHACTEWMSGNCSENCRFPHSWVDTKSKKHIKKVAELKEHSKTVTGIVLPPGSNILYTGSKDGTLRATDANTGKCIDCINVGAEVGCIVSEQSWVFVGVPNAIWAWNIQTSQRLSLEGPALSGKYDIQID